MLPAGPQQRGVVEFGEELRQLPVASFRGWHSAVIEMIQAAASPIAWALFTVRPRLRWHRDRVVILGDAAHGMLPHHGRADRSPARRGDRGLLDRHNWSPTVLTSAMVQPLVYSLTPGCQGLTRVLARVDEAKPTTAPGDEPTTQKARGDH